MTYYHCPEHQQPLQDPQLQDMQGRAYGLTQVPCPYPDHAISASREIPCPNLVSVYLVYCLIAFVSHLLTPRHVVGRVDC